MKISEKLENIKSEILNTVDRLPDNLMTNKMREELTEMAGTIAGMSILLKFSLFNEEG